jgi:hypothetical protein
MLLKYGSSAQDPLMAFNLKWSSGAPNEPRFYAYMDSSIKSATIEFAGTLDSLSLKGVLPGKRFPTVNLVLIVVDKSSFCTLLFIYLLQ